MLTKKQSDLLRFIHERLKETGVPPSFDEMKDALDLRSKSGIHRLILALEERGFIRRLPNRARALEVLRLPESATPSRVQRPLRKIFALRYRGQSRPRAAVARTSRERGGTTGRRPRYGTNRRRHADFSHSNPQPHHRSATRISRQRRSFRARSARRFDDRGRHSGWRHRRYKEAGHSRHRRHCGRSHRR